MENRLSHIDSIAKDALQNLEFPYQPADWAAMESRIEKDAFLRTRLYWLKGGELLLMLLAFWVLFQFTGMTFPDAPAPQHIPPVKQQFQPPIQENNALPAEEKTPENIDNQKETRPKKEAEEELHFAQNTNISNSKFQIPNSNTRIPAIQITPDVATPKTYSAKTVHPRTHLSQAIEESVIQHSQLATRNPQLVTRLPSIQVLVESRTKHDAAATAEIDPLPERKQRMHLRIAASPDMNTSANTSRMGMTFGGLTSVELSDKWQVETGLAYSGKFFNDLPTQNTAFPNIAMKDMNLHLVEVPLHAQYTIKKSINWRPFVTAGFTANAVMYAQHEYSNDNEEPFPPQDAAGIIEGGAWKDNLYATADIGLGLERQLDRNLHLFIQPTVKFALDDTAHHERIHTFSLVMGARTAL